MPDVTLHAITTTVNGRPHEADIDVRTLLAEFLRDTLGLKGTKVSCEMQVCGACTVLVDGEPASSCTFLAVDVDGREVTTIEGLGNGDELDPVQQAFADCTGLQCGYCTPGFVLSTKAFLDREPQPDDERIRHVLEGNLCRCTGYVQIVDAVHRACELREAGRPRG